ncbi:MAG TPA: hypothetical protein VHT97_11110 [Acidimicrobiales bacterium]|nr:hypothetical protein [Acidimicrobiales bacterium]
MAELPELRSDRLVTPPPPHAPLYGRPPAFGVARDLELMKQGQLPARTPRPPRRSRLNLPTPDGRGSVRARWASRDTGPTDLWHRLLCRFGHHEMRGGHQLQLGSQFVYVERRCKWCDTPA